MIIRTYSELIQLPTFEERYDYLRLCGVVGNSTFGFDRYLNQIFYNSDGWKSSRDFVIRRDRACDLGIPGREICGYDKNGHMKDKRYAGIRIHHMNPVTVDDIKYYLDVLLDPEFLICTSLNTHNAIHFGDRNNLFNLPAERRKGDTTPWRVY